MSKRKLIETWKKVTKVKLAENVSSGFNEFNVDNFKRDKSYEVIGITYKRYYDGSGCYCYLVIDDDGVLAPKVVTKFVVVETQ